MKTESSSTSESASEASPDKEKAIAAFLERHDLSAEDVAYLDDRLHRMLKVADRLAPIFFGELFNHMPQAEHMFDDDDGGARLIMYRSILWSAAACLKDPEQVHARLEEIGETHAQRGISSLQLRTGQQASLDSLAHMLPKLEYREREDLWQKIYQIIVDAMQPNFTVSGTDGED